MNSNSRFGMLLLVCVLITVYTLTNSGGFHIIDEPSRFAVTESLARRGAVDTNIIAWSQWATAPKEAQGAFGPDGDVYSKKGPAYAFVTLPWYGLLRLLSKLGLPIGVLQGSMLFNGLLTALTAGLLWATAQHLGYGDRVGAVLGLLYGLATIAWPYATYFLGEPLSALSLLACFYCLVRWRQQLKAAPSAGARTEPQIRWLVLAGIAAGTAIATVVVHVALVAVLGVYWVASTVTYVKRDHQGQRRPRTRLLTYGLLFALPVVGALLLVAWYNTIRFGNPLNTGYQLFSGESFNTPIWQGLWGFLASPYRGVFWHTPLFLASIIAFPAFWQRHRMEALTIAGMTVLLIGLYSMWWMWWGGYAWGPRFLVAVTPFWVLVLAPWTQRLGVGDRTAVPARGALSRWGTVTLLGGLVLLSVAIQFSAVMVNYVNYETELRGIFPTDWLDPLKYGPPAQSLADALYSPVLGQWRLIIRDLVGNTDVAWLRADGTVLWPVVIVGALALATLAVASARWWRQLDRSSDAPNTPGSIPGWILPLIPVLVMAFWLVQASSDPRYGIPGERYRAILEEIEEQADPTDVIVTTAPFHYPVSMNWFEGNLPIYGYAADSAQYPEAQQVLSRLNNQHARLWYVIAAMPPADPANTVERWLAQHAYEADDRWFGDFRLVRYATGVGLEQSSPVPLGIDLAGLSYRVTLTEVQTPHEVRAGQHLPVSLRFQLRQSGSDDLRWFVQLLAEDGAPVALWDGPPQGGYERFPDLPTETLLEERVSLLLPSVLDASTYRLIAGLYAPDHNAQRLPTSDGRDHVELGTITVVPGTGRP